MKSLLELGKSLVGEMKCQYKDCFYRYVDENSFNDETYLAIGKKLFSDKEKYIDYMSHIYEEDFDWTQSNVNSFDYIQNIVDIAIKESNKYIWSDEYNAHIPVIKYDSSFRSIPLTNFKNPCCIKNLTAMKRFTLKDLLNVEMKTDMIYYQKIMN